MIQINTTNSYTEIYASGGGKWITQSAPTNVHCFWKRKILTADESVDDYREVTEAQKTELEKSDAAWTRPSQVLIDAWNRKCNYYQRENSLRIIGRYNEDSGFFELNGLLDINTQEAIDILEAGDCQRGRCQALYSCNAKMRTNFPAEPMAGIEVGYPFYYCKNIEVINATNIVWRFPVFGAPRLHTIIGLADVMGDGFRIADQPSLVNLTIMGLTRSIDLGNQPGITMESLAQIVANAKNTKEISIKLHADVFAKLPPELVDSAATKNITFTT